MLALRNLLRRKIRTALTLIGVGIGIATVVSLVAVARGMRQQFNALFADGDAHLVLSGKDAADPFISYLPETLLDELAGHPGVASAHPFLFAAVQIPRQPIFLCFGTTAGSPVLGDIRIVDGESPFEPGTPPRSVCLGSPVAEFLDKEVGDALTLKGQDYTVVGIFETTRAFLAAGTLLPFAEAQALGNLEGKMSMALVGLTDYSDASIAAAELELEERWPEVEATPPATFADAYDEFEMVEQMTRVLALLATIVGGIGVMNTMLMSVFERTREIGILQAIGWSKAMILRQVLAEGLLVSVFGGLFGIVLGFFAVELISSFGQFAMIHGEYGPGLLTMAMGVSAGMGLVGVLWPALRAVRISPIEALRYE